MLNMPVYVEKYLSNYETCMANLYGAHIQMERLYQILLILNFPSLYDFQVIRTL